MLLLQKHITKCVEQVCVFPTVGRRVLKQCKGSFESRLIGCDLIKVYLFVWLSRWNTVYQIKLTKSHDLLSKGSAPATERCMVSVRNSTSLWFFGKQITASALRLHLPSSSSHNGSLTKAPSQNLAQRMSWQQWAICYQGIATCWLSLAHTFAPYWKWSEEVLQTTYGEGTDVLPGYTVLLVRRRATLKYLHVPRLISPHLISLYFTLPLCTV